MVGGAFEAVVVGSVSFDHSGICSVPAWGLGRSVISWVVSVSAAVSVLGGKARLVGDLAADRAVASDKGQVVGIGADGVGCVFHDVAYRVVGEQ